jgi:hypothetical protein
MFYMLIVKIWQLDFDRTLYGDGRNEKMLPFI